MNPFRDEFIDENRRFNQGHIPEEIRTGIRSSKNQLRASFRQLFLDICFIGSERYCNEEQVLNERIEELMKNNEPFDNELVRVREINRLDLSNDNFAMRIYDHFRTAFNRIERYELERQGYDEYLIFLEDLIANLDDLQIRDNIINEILETELENQHNDIDKFYQFLNIPLGDPIGRFLYIEQESGGSLGAHYRLQHA